MRFFRDILLTALSLIAVLALFELGLRITGAKYESSFYENDPVLYMTLRPDAHGWEAKEGENYVQINSVGMRDREHSFAAPLGTTRVAVLGDSMVEAEQVPLERTMAQSLERNLNASITGRQSSAEVLNFGVGGYTLAQEYLMLHNRVWKFHPSVVLLILSPSSVPGCSRKLYGADVPYFIIRDGAIIPDPKNRPPAGASQSERRRHQIVGNLMNRFRLLQMIRKATQSGIPHEIARLKGAKPDRNANIMDMWYRPPETPEQEQAWRVAEGLLVRMAQEARDQGAEFWISAVGNEIEEDPIPADRHAFMKSNGITTFAYSQARIAAIAGAHNIGFVSLEPELLRYSEQHQVSLRGFFNTAPNRGHWNEEGNAAAAAVIAKSLLAGSVKLTQGTSTVSVLPAVPSTQTDAEPRLGKMMERTSAALSR